MIERECSTGFNDDGVTHSATLGVKWKGIYAVRKPFLTEMMLNEYRTSFRNLTHLTAIITPVIGLLATNAFPAMPSRTGDQIFRQQCASCHGAKGEGTKS